MKRKDKNIKEEIEEIVGAIPFMTSIWDADFVIFENGKVGELTKGAQARGLLVVKRRIKNISAGIRMYLLYILGRYINTLRAIKGTEVEFLGQLEEIDLWKIKIDQFIEEWKKDKPISIKELEMIIGDFEKEKEKLDKKIQEIKKKKIEIGKWALKKAKILMKEKQRIVTIIESLFIELSKIYDICKDTEINSLFKEFVFGKSYSNLKGEIEKLKTIKAHFIDYPDDLKKVREVERQLLVLETKDGSDFVNLLKRIIDIMTPLIEGPLEYSLKGKRYIIQRGEIKCL